MNIDTELSDVGLKKLSPPARRERLLRGLIAIQVLLATVSVLPEAFTKYHFHQTPELLSMQYNPFMGLNCLGALPGLVLVSLELIVARRVGLRGWEFARVLLAVGGLGFVQYNAILPECQ